MAKLRFSISRLMALVAQVAFNLALVPAFLASVNNVILFGVSGSLVMANMVTFGGLLLASKPRRPRPFLVGFVAGGTAALLAYVVAVACFPHLVLPLLLRYADPFERWADANLTWLLEPARESGSVPRLALWLITIGVCGLPATVMQLAIALGGGAVVSAARRGRSRPYPA